ncbi:HAD family hydrolase [Paractinoplanes ferrugineus]|uniref:HAD family hydrolase n=1 Tax=Paractinoplanes ferrugineus TaxID=113564 RepID=A0A919MG35_9ACTN|nr:HAD family hydrolase [Actinoplanes ferrugineus]GIE13429.1 HAD family hydrolase [Actinoplanes ferrugineus]
MLRGVLLDLDNTLVDQRAATAEALHRWLPSLGVPCTPELLVLWDEVAERHFKAWRERRVTFREQRRGRLREFLPRVRIPYAEGELDAIFADYLIAYESSWRAFPDVDQALAAIAAAGLRTAVLTNGSTEQQHQKLARTGLTGRLGPVFTVEDVGTSKPDPAAFLSACARWGLPPASVLSVGDRHDLDVLPARRAGLLAVHLDRHDGGPHDEPHRIRSLAELPLDW